MSSPILPPDLAAPIAAPLPPALPPAPLPWDSSKWDSRIKASRDFLKPIIEAGKKNVSRWRGNYLDSVPTESTVKVPADFWITEAKRAKLFYRVPEVTLKAKNPTSEGRPKFLMQAVLNDYLGPDHTNALTAMDEGVYDIICPVGYMALKIGYTPVLGAPVTLDDIDPETGAPRTMQPVVDDEYYIRRIPPGRLLFPADFIGSDFDDADWIGMTFYEAAPDGTQSSAGAGDQARQELLFTPSTANQRPPTNLRRGVEIWYKAAKLDDDVTDAKLLRTFIWMEGDDAPKAGSLRDSPYHRIKGFPIKVGSIRYSSDAAVSPSDIQIVRHLIDEQSVGRTQALRQRDRSLPQTLFDNQRVTQDTLAKIERNELGGLVGVEGPPAGLFQALEKPTLSPESYTFNSTIERDIEKAMALGSNQTGVQAAGGQTATETNTVQFNADTVLDYSRNKIIDFFCNKVAATLAGLLQEFADATKFVPIIGPDGAMELAAWNKTDIQGEFGFTIRMNSQLRPDSAADLKRTTDWINYSAKSPYINQQENWRLAAEAFGMDPSRLLTTPQPPKPEPPTISFSVKGEDLIPFAPQYGNVLAILVASGIQGLAPVAPLPLPLPGPPQNALTPGSAPKADLLDKHVADETGQLSGPTIPHAPLANPAGRLQ